MDEGFQYVVERKEQSRICFLSTKSRTTGFNKTSCGSDTLYMLPTSVDKILKKVSSLRGVPGLANLAPRFPKENLDQTPPPNRYNLDCKLCLKKECGCLGGRAKRFKSLGTDVPSPNLYMPWKSVDAYQIKKYHSFGGRAQVIPVAEIRCMVKPSDKCEICHQICTDDYWQRINSFMCFLCMQKMMRRKKKPKNLEKYKKVRECSFIHQHDGTPFAINLMSKNQLKNSILRECYLNMYFS